MSAPPPRVATGDPDLCTWSKDPQRCDGCDCSDKIQCRLKYKDLAYFWILTTGICLPSFLGMILGGHLNYLLLYLGIFLVCFLFLIPSVLCRHCPYYAEKGFILRCPAHYGSIKILKFSPAELNRFEKAMVFCGFLVLFGYPLPFLLASGQWTLFTVASWNIITWLCTMRKFVCATCLNFSCPMNGVPPEMAEKYRRRNPQVYGAA